MAGAEAGAGVGSETGAVPAVFCCGTAGAGGALPGQTAKAPMAATAAEATAARGNQNRAAQGQIGNQSDSVNFRQLAERGLLSAAILSRPAKTVASLAARMK